MTLTDSLALDFGSFLLLRPLWLLALPPLAGLWWHLARRHRHSAQTWERLVSPALLPHLLVPARPRRAAAAALGAALCLTVTVLAGPALPGASELALRTDATRVLVVDLSRGLAERSDALPTLERMRLKLLGLLRTQPPGHTALVVYGEEPYLVAPLTTDAETLALLVPELAPEALPLSGDRAERALRMAGEILLRSGSAARDVVWFSANAHPTPAALQVAEAIREQGMRLSLLQFTAGEPPGAVLQRLQALARDSGGLPLSPSADDTDLRALAALLARGGNPLPDGTRRTTTPREIGVWLLPLLLPLGALAFGRGVLFALALPLLIQSPLADASERNWWSRPDQRARAHLEAGEPQAAAALFTDPRWQAVAHYRAGDYAAAAAALAPFKDPDSLYNRGTALARLDRLPEALEALEHALAQRPDDPDIRHNRDLVRELLERKGTPPAPDEGDAEQPSVPPQAPPADAPPSGDRGAESDVDGDPQTGPERPGDADPAPPAEPAAAPDSTPAGAGNAAPDAAASAPVRPPGDGDAEREAALLAEQWLRRVPDEPAGLLRRKLLLEHQRRQSGAAGRPWQ